MIVLPIKKKWLDMIVSGQKKEEYRSLTHRYRLQSRQYSISRGL